MWNQQLLTQHSEQMDTQTHQNLGYFTSISLIWKAGLECKYSLNNIPWLISWDCQSTHFRQEASHRAWLTLSGGYCTLWQNQQKNYVHTVPDFLWGFLRQQPEWRNIKEVFMDCRELHANVKEVVGLLANWVPIRLKKNKHIQYRN